MSAVPKPKKTPQDPHLFDLFVILTKKLEQLLPGLPPFSPIGREWRHTRIEESLEHKRFVEGLVSDRSFAALRGKHVFSDSVFPMTMNENGLTGLLLDEYMTRRRRWTVYGDTLREDIYVQWESLFTNAELDCYAIGFLENTGTDKVLTLDEETVIRILNMTERHEWQERLPVLGEWGLQESRNLPWYVVEANWRETKQVTSEVKDFSKWNNVPQNLKVLMHAIRLFGAPRAYLSLSCVSTDLRTPRIVYGLPFLHEWQDPASFFLFNKELSDKFKQFWVSVRDRLRQRKESWWTNAMRRYERSMLDDYAEDRLVDLVIALEGCLTVEHGETHLRRAFSQRIAVLNSITSSSGRNPDADIHDLAYKCYGLRNDVVHGNVADEKKVDECLEPLREEARASFLRLLAMEVVNLSNKKREDFVLLLDKAVLRQKHRNELKRLLAKSSIANLDQMLEPKWWMRTDVQE